MNAKEKGLTLYVYANLEDFMAEHHIFDKEVSIYIDSNLGKNVRGEVESVRIYELGFLNIYLTTGYDDIDIKIYPLIKAVVSKKPPF